MIHKYLDLSTAHVTPEDNHALEAGTGWPGAKNMYGYWVWVPSNPNDPGNREWYGTTPLSENLWHVIEYAREQDCDYIHFDRDGDTINDLPTYDW